MGKASMCIQLLQLMSSRRTYKCSELADLLETNPRNIIEYKRELEEAGYYIVSIPGKYGGYKLDTSSVIPSLCLTEEEKKVLLVGVDYLKAHGDFIDGHSFQLAMKKIFASIEKIPLTGDTVIIPGVTLSMPGEEIKKRYQIIEESIYAKTKVCIDFLSHDNVIRQRIIHPYKLFIHKNSWFVLAFCEQINEVAYFKLNRIEKISKVKEKFRIPYSYNERDYLDENGLKKAGDWSNENCKDCTNEWVHIKLQLSGRPAMYTKEYIYGQNQVIQAVDKDTTILECDMHYRYNTIKFVLGFGTDCKVLEPLWLKKEVKKIAGQMAKEE